MIRTNLTSLGPGKSVVGWGMVGMVGCAVIPVEAGLPKLLCNVPALLETVCEADTGVADTGGCCFFFRFSLKHSEQRPSVAGEP